MERKIQEYVNKWEQRCYQNGLPDEAPKEIFDMVPSYKKIAIAILKNDLSLLGVNPPHSVYYDILKRIELEERRINTTQ